MKINLTQITETLNIPVWRGRIENNYVVKNGNIDLISSKKRYNYFWELRHGN